MFELVRKPLAAADLSGIWSYSFETQADFYLEQIEAALFNMANDPARSK